MDSGDGNLINCIKDPWLGGKAGFKVDQDKEYVDNRLTVSHLFQQNSRAWDETKISEMFSSSDVSLILSTRIPPNQVADRLTWSLTTNGKYYVKTGYQL